MKEYQAEYQASTRPPRRLLAVKLNNFIEDQQPPQQQKQQQQSPQPQRHRKFSKDKRQEGSGSSSDKKKRCKNSSKTRPVTATLAKPRLLDATLLGKIDMSLMRKELLSVYRLLRMPLRKHHDADGEFTGERKESKSSSKKSKSNRPKIVIESLASPSMTADQNKTTPKRVLKIPAAPKPAASFRLFNVRSLNPGDNLKKLEAPPPPPSVPKPCDSCGRESRPERLHAHPRPRDTNNNTAKAGHNIRDSSLLHPTASSVASCHSSTTSPSKPHPTISSASPACGHCGRRFGAGVATALLAAHEKKCRERQPKRGSHSSTTGGGSDKENGGNEKTHSSALQQRLSPAKGWTRPGDASKKNESDIHQKQKDAGSDANLINSVKRRSSLSIVNAEPTPRSPDEDAEWTSHLRSLVRCAVCERAFAPDRVLRHQSICDGSSKRSSNNTSIVGATVAAQPRSSINKGSAARKSN